MERKTSSFDDAVLGCESMLLCQMAACQLAQPVYKGQDASLDLPIMLSSTLPPINLLHQRPAGKRSVVSYSWREGPFGKYPRSCSETQKVLR